jgi:hypothetical protein
MLPKNRNGKNVDDVGTYIAPFPIRHWVANSVAKLSQVQSKYADIYIKDVYYRQPRSRQRASFNGRPVGRPNHSNF